MELLLPNTAGRFLAPLRCSAELCADLNWLESLLVTKYQVTNRKRVPTNEFRENEQKTVLPTQNKVSPSQKKSALPDMSSCVCFTLIADNSSAHHVSTGKLGGSHISTSPCPSRIHKFCTVESSIAFCITAGWHGLHSCTWMPMQSPPNWLGSPALSTAVGPRDLTSSKRR